MPAFADHRVAVYTGVFDPVHLGHLHIIARGSRIFDRLVVGVGNNPEKTPFFTIEERVELISRIVAAHRNVEVRPFTGLAVRFVGEAVAVVLAQTREQAQDAVDAIDVRYDALPAIADLGSAAGSDGRLDPARRAQQRPDPGEAQR